MIMSGETHHPPGVHPEWKSHWEEIYAERRPAEVSWFQAHPEYSLSLIEASGVGRNAGIIDIGGGASMLVDHLLMAGYGNVTVLDIARSGIDQARARLGALARKVTWLEQDVTDFTPEWQFDIWHDRAVFHFLTGEADRMCYVETLKKALKPYGQAIIATFSENGPMECNGLDVLRYTPESLDHAMGRSFYLSESRVEDHHMPDGGIQQFIYCRFCRQHQEG
jgi:SAM-dependent methyltransferase